MKGPLMFNSFTHRSRGSIMGADCDGQCRLQCGLRWDHDVWRKMKQKKL